MEMPQKRHCFRKAFNGVSLPAYQLLHGIYLPTLLPTTNTFLLVNVGQYYVVVAHLTILSIQFFVEGDFQPQYIVINLLENLHDQNQCLMCTFPLLTRLAILPALFVVVLVRPVLPQPHGAANMGCRNMPFQTSRFLARCSRAAK